MRKIREAKRPKVKTQGALSGYRKRLPKWEIEGRFEDHPDADKDRRFRYIQKEKKCS